MTTQSDASANGQVRVWDIFVRCFHWSLVVLYFIAYFTEDDLMQVHGWAGYLVGALLGLRVIWGVIGPRYARFSSFTFGPLAAGRYLLQLFAFRAPRHLGHSPAGGFMVLLLLVTLAVAVVTGLAAYGNENKGPMAPLFADGVETATVPALISTAHADDDDHDDHDRGEDGGDGEDGDEFWEELHEMFANLTLILIIAHVSGVVLASLVHRENLPRSMITGRKRGHG